MPLTSLPANVTKSLRFAKKLQDDDKIQFAMFCRHYARKCLINESRVEYEQLISILDAKIKSVVQSLMDQSQSTVFPDYSDEIEDYVDKLLIDALSRSKNNITSRDKDLELAEEIIVAYSIIMQFDPAKKESKEILQKQAAASNLHIQLKQQDAPQQSQQSQQSPNAADSTKVDDEEHQMKLPVDQRVEMGDKDATPLLEEPGDDDVESYDPLIDLSDDAEEEKRVVEGKKNLEMSSNAIIGDDLQLESLKVQSQQQLGGIEEEDQLSSHPKLEADAIDDDQKVAPENAEEDAFDANYVVTNDVENTLAIRNMRQVLAPNSSHSTAAAARVLTSQDISDFLMEICETTMRDRGMFIGEHDRDLAAKLFLPLSDCFEIIINKRTSMYGAATLSLLTFSQNLLRQEILNHPNDNTALKVQSLFLNIKHYLGHLFVSKASDLKDEMILLHQDRIEKYLVNTVLSFTQKNYIIGISWSLMTIKLIVCSLDI